MLHFGSDSDVTFLKDDTNMIQQHFSCIMDALELEGWSLSEIHSFIEASPYIWLQALRMRVREAVDHISMFIATGSD